MTLRPIIVPAAAIGGHAVLVLASTSGSPTKATLYLATYAFGLTLPAYANGHEE